MADPTLSKKRYVPLAEAARISGYTHEYINRLCRIGKIPCRMMGDKTIVELDALLSQTGTILMGSEHVGFIELDDNSPYPLIAPVGEMNVLPVEPEEKSESRLGRIAVVGETIRTDDAEVGAQPKGLPTETGEKFPSNALPFFSSVPKNTKRTGVHIAVSTGEVSSQSISSTPSPTQKESKHPIHLAIGGGDAEKQTLATAVSPTTALKSISVMPQSVPSGFVPAIPPPASAPRLAPGTSVGTPAPTGVAPQHDHDMMRYTSKLPMLFQPMSLARKALLAVFAFGIFVAPSALGVGNVLNNILVDFGGALHATSRATMAAVGLINPQKDTALFPYLVETSRLLSATGASVNSGTNNNGVVVTPSTGNASSDQAIKDAVKKTFSDPVQVIPDGKDGQSGMIRPVFQKNNSAGYIYMMVPVNN